MSSQPCARPRERSPPASPRGAARRGIQASPPRGPGAGRPAPRRRPDRLFGDVDLVQGAARAAKNCRLSRPPSSTAQTLAQAGRTGADRCPAPGRCPWICRRARPRSGRGAHAPPRRAGQGHHAAQGAQLLQDVLGGLLQAPRPDAAAPGGHQRQSGTARRPRWRGCAPGARRPGPAKSPRRAAAGMGGKGVDLRFDGRMHGPITGRRINTDTTRSRAGCVPAGCTSRWGGRGCRRARPAHSSISCRTRSTRAGLHAQPLDGGGRPPGVQVHDAI